MNKILFYVTGHGFGHATRVIEVINQILVRRPDLLPIINTTVPEWLFRREVRGGVQYVHCESDVGVVQTDWRRVEKLETLRRCDDLLKREPEFVRTQVDFISREDVSAIVSDIPAVAFRVAREAGIPGFGITNFSWDWIYASYLDEFPAYRGVVQHMRENYAMAERLLRLPFHGDLSAFASIEDIPLIARHASLNRSETLERIGLDRTRRLVLMYLGDLDHERVLPAGSRARNDYLFVAFDSFSSRRVSFQDVLAAADAVVTKPGYGIVSDCIANRTPILYTERADFPEYQPLVDGIQRYAHGGFVPLEDLLRGTWLEHLERLLAAEPQWAEVATNGAEVAAERILDALRAK